MDDAEFLPHQKFGIVSFQKGLCKCYTLEFIR